MSEPARIVSPLRPRVPLFAVLLLLAVALPAAAWTPDSRLAIARQAARIAPPDLARQIDRYPAEFQRGVLSVGEPLEAEVRAAIEAIRRHRPFSEVVLRAGRICALAAAVNDPMAAADGSLWVPDFRRYVDSARPRFRVVFYGDGRALHAPTDLSRLLQRAGRRGSAFVPFLTEEYRRIGGPPENGRFDDRSTAFGVAAVSFSHAVSDAGALLRYLWIDAGGADPRPLPLTPATAP